MNIFADALAHASSREQADFLNRFSYRLTLLCKDHGSLDMQLCYVSDELDSNGMAFIEALADFVRLRKEYVPKDRDEVQRIRDEKYRLQKEIEALEDTKRSLEETLEDTK